jgi:hypothetical protein
MKELENASSTEARNKVEESLRRLHSPDYYRNSPNNECSPPVGIVEANSFEASAKKEGAAGKFEAPAIGHSLVTIPTQPTPESLSMCERQISELLRQKRLLQQQLQARLASEVLAATTAASTSTTTPACTSSSEKYTVSAILPSR